MRERLQQARYEADAVRARCTSLVGFVREAWPILEPDEPFVHGWHLDAIAEHLEAISTGQLNRLLMNVPPGPMRHNSIVETARGPVLLSEIVVGDKVLTHMGRYRRVSAVHEQGVLPILRIETHSGRVTYAAPSHPYLTPRGWVDARDLRIGDKLAVVNRAEERPGAIAMADEAARLLGYMVGDGSATQGTPGFTNGDREVIDDFHRCATALGFETSETQRASHWHVRLLGKPARDFLTRHDLMGKSSYTKRVPAAIMASDRETIGAFIGAYWTCDGGFDVRATNARGSRFRAYGTTVSEGLAHDLVSALALIGIEARLRRKERKLETARQPGGVYRSFSIEVQREEMTARFAALSSLCSTKRALAEKCGASFDRPLWDDPIVSIESDAPARCLCLTVEGDHSFTCSGIAVKNTMKSLLTGVFWPAWEWGPGGKPGLRIFGSSYSEDYAKRDSRRMRDLVTSEWYQELWPGVAITKSGETEFHNARKGWRKAVPFSRLTGGRGDRVIVDDPLGSEQAESLAERKRATRIFRESLPSRVISPERSAIVIIMQRLHEQDVSGVILAHAEKFGYEHLCLPMEFEADRRCKTSIGFVDPRTKEGELLFPERFPQTVVDRDKAVMGSYAVAGQFQQRPSPRGGGVFKREWFVPIGDLPANIDRTVRAWDFGATEGAGDYTAATLMSRTRDGLYIIRGCKRVQGGAFAVELLFKNLAKMDGPSVFIRYPQDPGAAGKTMAAHYAKHIAGHAFKAERPTGSKEVRAQALAASAQAGNVRILVTGNPDRDAWIEPFLDELCVFPAGVNDDQVDATADAFNELALGTGGYSLEGAL